LDALNKIRVQVDEILFNDHRIIENEPYFGQEVMTRICHTLKAMNLDAASQRKDRVELQRLIVQEYTNQYKTYNFKAA